MDYTITHRPHRKNLPNIPGFQISGSTTFEFIPEKQLTTTQYKNIIENILQQPAYVYSKSPDRNYYYCFAQSSTDGKNASMFDLAIQSDCLTIFVKTATTEQSIESFHTHLQNNTKFSWECRKHERNINGI